MTPTFLLARRLKKSRLKIKKRGRSSTHFTDRGSRRIEGDEGSLNLGTAGAWYGCRGLRKGDRNEAESDEDGEDLRCFHMENLGRSPDRRRGGRPRRWWVGAEEEDDRGALRVVVFLTVRHVRKVRHHRYVTAVLTTFI